MTDFRSTADIKPESENEAANAPKLTLHRYDVFTVIELTILFISSISISVDSVLLL